MCASVYTRRMDSVAGLLDGARARGAFLLRSILSPPWSMRIEDEAPLTLVTMLRGDAYVTYDDGSVTRVGAGDVAIMRGPDPYTVADAPATAPQITILPGQRCIPPEGGEAMFIQDLDVRAWGNDPDGETVMLNGTYEHASETSRRLLNALPRLLVVPADSWDTPLIGFLANEMLKDAPGQDAVLDRLLDLLLIAVLREWFTRPEAEAPGWYTAHSDPVVGPALKLLQDSPEKQWTLAGLARDVGVSRAALARRFNTLVGEPPMAYLTAWRLTLAADLLSEPGATVGSVAPRVGYGSSFALSTAFKRVRGISPQQHRAAVLAA